MDQQLKERLVGAAVLVALTAIFVPMVLDGPAPPSASVPATVAPAPVDASTFGYDLTAPLPGVPAPAAPAAAPTTVAATATSAPKAAVPKVSASRPITASPAPAPSPAVATPAKPKAESTAPKSGSAAPSSGGWAAQVGSFSKEATAQTIAADLKRRGFKAFVMEHREGGKTLYRVRVGPVMTREAADALGSKITQQTGQAARPVRHP